MTVVATAVKAAGASVWTTRSVPNWVVQSSRNEMRGGLSPHVHHHASEVDGVAAAARSTKTQHSSIRHEQSEGLRMPGPLPAQAHHRLPGKGNTTRLGSNEDADWDCRLNGVGERPHWTQGVLTLRVTRRVVPVGHQGGSGFRSGSGPHAPTVTQYQYARMYSSASSSLLRRRVVA